MCGKSRQRKQVKFLVKSTLRSNTILEKSNAGSELLIEFIADLFYYVTALHCCLGRGKLFLIFLF